MPLKMCRECLDSGKRLLGQANSVPTTAQRMEDMA